VDHNRHYWPVLFEALPARPGRVLDVGCGTGALSRELHRRGWALTAVDRDRRSIEAARSHPDGLGVSFILGDFLSQPFEPASFDAIVCVAALHHMDMSAALGRMHDLLRAGGVLAVLGLAHRAGPTDLARDVVGTVANTLLSIPEAASRIRRRPPPAADAVTAPTLWPPPLGWDAVRSIAAARLPGVIYRRHVLWRYSLVWVKPNEALSTP
jgi:SAM-dependent methyltransferase